MQMKEFSRDENGNRRLIALAECNERIEERKRTIRRFYCYKKWYNPFYYFIYSHEEIKENIERCKFIIRLNVITKIMILKKHEH